MFIILQLYKVPALLLTLQDNNSHPFDYTTVIGTIAAVVIIPITIWGIISSKNTTETKRFELSVLPRLFIEGIEYKGYNGEIAIILNNKGEVAHVTGVKYISGEVYIYPVSVPFDLDKAMQKFLSVRFNDPNRTDCEFQIELLFDNVLKQSFHAIITGKEGTIKFNLQERIKR